jgi:hypothetical protein
MLTKNITGQRGGVVAILHENEDFWNSLSKINSTLPLILADGGPCLYALIKDVSDELYDFILTGNKNQDSRYHVLPDKQGEAAIIRWEKLGLTVTQHIRRIEYLRHEVTIVCPKISNPEIGASIILLPWFLLPDRSHPTFVYLYAIWHYHKTDRKSQKESAAATGKIFRIEKFNKSTVCRSIKAMEHFVDISRLDRPLSTDEQKTAACDDLLERIPEVLAACQSPESLQELYGEMVKSPPTAVRRKETICNALSRIPDKLSKVIKPREAAGRRSDPRKRPRRKRNNELRHVQHRINFVEFQQIEDIRIAFIEACRHLVMDAAVTYHQFLV